MIATDWQILEAIRWYVGDNGYSPTVRELCRETGIKSTSAMSYRLRTLRDRGFIEYVDRTPRTIRLTERGECKCR